MNGYIYIRDHYSYKEYNCCKLGKTSNYIDRDSTYTTGEIVRGKFIIIYEVPLDKMDMIEKVAHMAFKEYNVLFDGGKEFYDYVIVTLIDSFFHKVNSIFKISCRKLDSEEIDSMIRNIRTKNNKIIKDDKDYDYFFDLYNNFKEINPRKDQEEIIVKAMEYYKDPINTKGLLVIPCGAGKTMISLWLSLRFRSFMNIKTILIGVPNRLLLKQWEKVVNLLLPDFNCFLVDGDIEENDIVLYTQQNQNKKYVVITTYASSFKFSTINDFVFDVKILDEVHHLTSKKNEDIEQKTFIKILNIKCVKQIGLTATLKILDSEKSEIECISSISNDNNEYFGKIIDKKTLLWAIHENIICDYVIQTIVTDNYKFIETFDYLSIDNDSDKRLFISAFVSLKSIKEGCSHHLLIYNNNKENSIKIISYINIVKELLNIDNVFCSSYNSDMKKNEQKRILKDFEKSKYGIISCVYCLGEGWDFPILDGVVFSENMSSNIRIVQSALRASRKNILEPEKITKIILPVLYKDDFLDNENNDDLRKVKEVIYQMSLEDETIIEKFKVFKVVDRKDEKEKDEKEENKYEFGEYDEVMTKALRLKTVSRIQLNLTYEKTKKIIKPYHLNSKEEYYDLCKKDVRLPEDPEETFEKTFLGWFDYLGIDNEYYDLETCKTNVLKYINNNDKEYKKYTSKSDYTTLIKLLKKQDDMFPPFGFWLEYYKINDLSQIFKTSKKDKIVKF